MSKGTLATMDCNLICPIQVRMNDDKPKFLTEDPTNESHAISCEDNTGTLIDITLELKGVTSYSPQGSQPSMNLILAQGLSKPT